MTCRDYTGREKTTHIIKLESVENVDEIVNPTSAPPDEIVLRVQEAESLTGSKARIARLEFNKLRQLGVLLKVHVTGTTLFQVAASFSEYGVSEDVGTGKKSRKTRRRDVLMPGMKNLIPRSDINKRHSRENRARYCPKKYGYENLFSDDISDFNWIPYSAWGEFAERWQKIIDEDEAWKQDLIDRHAELRQWCADTFAQAAKEAWDALLAKRKLKPGESLKVGPHAFVSSESFVRWVVKDTLSHFPTKEDIAEKCQITYRISVLATSADLDAESAKQQTAQADIAEAQAKVENARTEVNAKIEEAKTKLAAMRDAEKTVALAQLEAARPLATFVNALNGKMLEMIAQFKRSIGNGSVPDKTARFGRGLLDVYSTLNAGVSDDRTVALLNDLREKIGTDAKVCDVGEVEDAVKALESELSKNVSEIWDAEPNRFRFLEL